MFLIYIYGHILMNCKEIKCSQYIYEHICFYIFGLNVCVHPWIHSGDEIWSSQHGSDWNIHFGNNMHLWTKSSSLLISGVYIFHFAPPPAGEGQNEKEKKRGKEEHFSVLGGKNMMKRGWGQNINYFDIIHPWLI